MTQLWINKPQPSYQGETLNTKTYSVNPPTSASLQKYHYICKGAYTLGIRDSRVESHNTMLASHLGLKPSCHENFMLS
jgi:hypothetical protein